MQYCLMRDGTALAFSVLLPAAKAPWPVLVARTPYGRSALAPLLSRFVDEGYALFIQDVRGRGDSQGRFDFFQQEPDDAIDTARFILGQPCCNGSLGLVGISYLLASVLT